MGKRKRILKAITFFEQFGERIWDKDLFRKKWFPVFIKLVKEYVKEGGEKKGGHA